MNHLINLNNYLKRNYNKNRHNKDILFTDCIKGGKYCNESSIYIPLSAWFKKDFKLAFPPIIYNVD